MSIQHNLKGTLTTAAFVAAMLAASGSASALPNFPHKKPGKDQGHGEIKFAGAIVDAPCSISQDTANQVVELGQVANSALAQGKEGPIHAYSIKLESCTFDTAKSVTVTFDGVPANISKSILAINGTAKGAGIVMSDEQGTPIELGIASTANSLNIGDNSLRFGARVVPVSDELDADSSGVTPGNFEATTTFKLSYQ